MKRIRNSPGLFFLLAALLLLAFFLPDLVGTVPGLIGGAVIIALSWFVYGNWSRDDSELPPPADETLNEQEKDTER